MKHLLTTIAFAGAAACAHPTTISTSGAELGAEMPTNPLFAASPLPFNYPVFDQLNDEHFAPAFERGMHEQSQEIEVIATNSESPTFANTIVAMERSGQLLSRATAIFYNLSGADTNPVREELRTTYAPKFAAHKDALMLNSALFARVNTLHDTRHHLGLDAEGLRLVERYYIDFVRAGAKLSDSEKETLKALNAEMATLGSQFSQRVLAEVNAQALVVDSAEELLGLSEAQINGAAEAAKSRNLKDKYVITLQNTTGQPPNTYLSNRALRERLHRASVVRGSQGNEHDTTAIVARLARLRAQRAQLLGYANHAAYVLEDSTAGSTEAVNQRLAELVPAAVVNARREAAHIEKLMRQDLGKKDAKLEPWDWAYYAEKVRQAQFNFDESQLRPYLELDQVLTNGVFFAANQLFGLTFEERHDLPVYHPDVRVFDVFEANGDHLAIFIGDFYARDSKRGGAWMNAYVAQSHLLGNKPVIGNHLNVPKPAQGQPTLLTWTEVTTLFHEFGHALHGMFSNVHYPYFAGTRVPRDFVEFPSQVNEMWASWPEVLKNYAKHHETGEAMPMELVEKVLATNTFNQGFATTEYLAATVLDQHWHQLAPEDVPSAEQALAFEAKALHDAGIHYGPTPPRYRTTYFSHTWGGGYSAGYYSYIWSEVLDADTVEWFKEKGGLSRKNGDWFRAQLLSRGGSADAMELFRAFRGRDAEIAPLLKRRGLVEQPAAKSSL